MDSKRLIALFCIFWISGVFGIVRIDPVFSSNMILQQKCPVVFFGSADKGQKVKVAFAGRTVSVKTDDKGCWRAEFPAMRASLKTYAITVSAGHQTIRLQNILIGDVWVCGGQSNMEMPLGWKFNRGWSALNCEQEVKNADYPLIRVADQANIISHNKPLPACYTMGGWEVCSPKMAGYMSAAGYFFARRLHKDTGLPIGLINLTAGGIRIEPWISVEGYENANLKKDLAVIRKYTMTPEQKKKFEADSLLSYKREIKAFREKTDALSVKQKADCAIFADPGYDDSKWTVARSRPEAKVIIRWYRTSFQIPGSMKGKGLSLHTGGTAMARGYEAYLNGHKIAEAASCEEDGKQRFDVRIPAESLDQNGKNVLAVRACFLYNWDDYARQESLLKQTELVCGKTVHKLGPWKDKDELLFDADKAGLKLPDDFTPPYQKLQFHCNFYYGMVDNWTRLPVKGVIWYHGCSNAGDPHYFRLLQALIADWRTKWNRKDMPFIIVQLAGYGDVNWKTSPPSESPYALTRDIQMQMLKLRNIGLVTAVDIGEPDNIHPANKQDVGLRLALEAERMAYGKNVLSRGPMFDHTETEGDSLRVFFRNVPTVLKTKDGKAPGAFAIAGTDKKFVWAKAKIDGRTVVVTSPSVRDPKYVRYAYADYRGDCNLCNAEGLPAYPFRSDPYDYSQVE